jgi:hypothetical protein
MYGSTRYQYHQKCAHKPYKGDRNLMILNHISLQYIVHRLGADRRERLPRSAGGCDVNDYLPKRLDEGSAITMAIKEISYNFLLAFVRGEAAPH